MIARMSDELERARIEALEAKADLARQRGEDPPEECMTPQELLDKYHRPRREPLSIEELMAKATVTSSEPSPWVEEQRRRIELLNKQEEPILTEEQVRDWFPGHSVPTPGEPTNPIDEVSVFNLIQNEEQRRFEEQRRTNPERD